MSRNLGCTSCYYCGGNVVLVENARVINPTDCGAHYYNEFAGMTVANAECPACLAQYIAWVSGVPGRSTRRLAEGETHLYLSFRSSFDDEPGHRDLPRYKIETQRVRTGPWTDTSYMRLGPVKP